MLPVTRAVQSGYRLLVLDAPILDASVPAQSLTKLAFTALMFSNTHTDFLPTVRRALCIGISSFLRTIGSLDLALLALSETRLESLSFVKAFCRDSSTPVLGFAYSDVFLFLHGARQMGVPIFVIGAYRSELSLIVLENAGASALPLRSFACFDAFLPPAGLSRAGSSFASSIYNFVALGSFLPLHSFSWLGLPPSVAISCLGSSLSPRDLMCVDFMISTCRAGSAGCLLPAFDFFLETFLSVQATSQPDFAASVYASIAIGSLIPLQACSHSGTSILVPGVKKGLVIPVLSFAAFGSSSPSQGCARVDSAAFASDFAKMNFLLLLKCVCLDDATSAHGSTWSGSAPTIPGVGDSELLPSLQSIVISGSRLSVAATASLDFLLLLQSPSCIGLLTLPFGNVCLGFLLTAPSAATSGLSPIVRSFVHLAFLPLFDSAYVESALLLHHFLHMGSGVSIKGTKQEIVEVASVEHAGILGATPPSRSFS